MLTAVHTSRKKARKVATRVKDDSTTKSKHGDSSLEEASRLLTYSVNETR